MKIMNLLPLLLILTAISFQAFAQGLSGGESSMPLKILDDGELDVLKQGVRLWSDRDYKAAPLPEQLEGLDFVRSKINASASMALRDGYALVITAKDGDISEIASVEAYGFQRVDIEPFVPFTGGADDGRDTCVLYQKKVSKGDMIVYGRYGITLFSQQPLPIINALNETITVIEPDENSLISIPTVDISGEKHRHSIIAAGTSEIYQGHIDTAVMDDGKTIFAAWSISHARHIGPLAKSIDGGKTWSGLIDVPDNWWHTSNTPTIHRLIDPEGVERLFVFGGGLDWLRRGREPYPMMQAVSEDGGETFSQMMPNGINGEVPPKSILSFDDGKRLVMWTDLPGFIVQAESFDGGLSWTDQRNIIEVPGRWGQPAVVRCPNGKQLLMLLRENNRERNSLYSVSNDKGQSWSEAKELPAALTGDRHIIRYAPDGRLVVAFRDRAGQGIEDWQSPDYGHFLAWVGTYEDIIANRQGQYRIKLMHSYAGADCAYSGLEILPDGTFVASSYIKYRPGAVKHSVVATRFNLEELDEAIDKSRRKQKD